MTQSVEFFFDFLSPYSYLASTQLESVDADIQLRPMTVLKVMDAMGNVPTTLTCKAKDAYAQQDMGRWLKRYRVAFNPSKIPLNDGESCAKAVLAAGNAQEAMAVMKALYQNIWEQAQTLKDVSAVLAALEEAGIETTGIAKRIESPETAAALDSNNEEAAKRGVFGAPTLFVGDAMFFGNDRLDFVREELAREEATA